MNIIKNTLRISAILLLVCASATSDLGTIRAQETKPLSGFKIMTVYVPYSWNGFSFQLPEQATVGNDSQTAFGAMIPAQDFGIKLSSEKINKKLTSADIKAFALQHIDEYSCEDSKAEFIEFNGTRAAEANGTTGNTGIKVIKFKKDKELISICIFYNLSDTEFADTFLESFKTEESE